MSKNYVAQGPTVDEAVENKLSKTPVGIPDVLQFLLFNWDLVGESLEDDTALKAALEFELAKVADKIFDYPELCRVIDIISAALQKFHEELKLQLGPLYEKYGVNHQVYLTRFLDRDIVIRIDDTSDLVKVEEFAL